MIEEIRRKIIRVFKNHSLPRWLVFLIDSCTVFFSFLIAYMLRYNFEVYTFDISIVFKQSYLVLAIYAISILVFKSYTGMIRHTTIRDTYKIIIANFSALTVLFLITILSRKNDWIPLFNIPLSILLIHYGAVTILLFFFRLFVKIFYEFASSTSHDSKNVLIYGSGEMGILVKRLIEGDPKNLYRLKGFIDDDKKIQGKKVDGYQVFSRRILTKDFIDSEDVKVFIIAINNIAPAKKKEVIESVILLGCEILDTPSFDTWMNGHLEVKNLKKVKFEDLLGRDPISLDLEKIQNGLIGKTILVTGGAGSIGSEIARQLTRFNIKQLILVDQAETPSFYLNEELKIKMPGCNFRIIIGDITRAEYMEGIFRKYKPEIVFHAAAYKHVPMMELNPKESIKVNIFGTYAVAEAAARYNVVKFILISTDKAIRPTSIMGASKRVAEYIGQAFNGLSGRTEYISVRFGNVLGSRGSVLPIFLEQLKHGGPITVTHPDMQRYFMTIPEAVSLVLQASTIGKGGEVLVLDMGEPVKILTLAEELIRLHGMMPYSDIDISFTGLRPGEKLFEEILTAEEGTMATRHEKIYVAKNSETRTSDEIKRLLEELKAILRETPMNDTRTIKNSLKKFVKYYSEENLPANKAL